MALLRLYLQRLLLRYEARLLRLQAILLLLLLLLLTVAALVGLIHPAHRWRLGSKVGSVRALQSQVASCQRRKTLLLLKTILIRKITRCRPGRVYANQ